MTNKLQTVNTAPAQGAEAVTPHDTNGMTLGVCRGLYVGVAGDLSILLADDTTAVFKNAPSGSLLSITAKRVNATGTTATDIVALY